jgi:hypothetical protein
MATAPSNRRWIWFFAVLALLAVAAVTIPIVYNMRRQLTREKLEAAIQLWAEKGPASYDLRYVVERPNTEPERYRAVVRDKKVLRAYRNDREMEPRLWSHQDMRGRYWDIQQFLEEDAKPGKPRAYAVAQFGKEDGRLIHYVRSVTGTRERLEISVSVTEVSGE